MERKLVKQGRNALTMTLPAEWTKKYGLGGGSLVNVDQEIDFLVIRPKSKKNLENKKIEVDIKGLERPIAYHMIFSNYIEGYDTIVVKNDDPKLVHNISKALIGFIVEEEKGEEIILKNIISAPEENIEEVLRRIFNLVVAHAKQLRKILDKEIDLKEHKDNERQIDNNILYCMRFINKYDLTKEPKKTFLLLGTMEYSMDIITKIGQYITKKDEKIVNLIVENVELYIQNLITRNTKKMYNDLRKFRNTVDRKTFIEGLTFSLAESLYNYMAYLIRK